MNTHVFIVYHNTINPNAIFNSKHYDTDSIKRDFTFFGVNELYEKKIIDDKGYNKLYEYDLTNYDPFLQKRGYMETSVYLHIYWNNLHKEYDNVGICQYDMVHSNPLPKLNNNTIIVQSTTKNIVAANKWHNMMCPHVRNLQFILDSYNKHFNKKYTVCELNGLPLSLWQTNIYPILIFEKLCKWLEVFVKEIYPWSIESPYETHWGVIGGFTERAIALFNALEKKNTIRLIPWMLDHRPRRLAVERFQYNPKHWINQFDLNIYTKFDGNISKDSFNKLNCIEIQDSESNSKSDFHYMKSNINKITHIYRVTPTKTSKSIILYLPENITDFKKRYLAIQDNLDKYKLYYDQSEKLYIVSMNQEVVYVWITKININRV